ncbi:hypothetical protein M405DRAFT_517162 [Rhizopogon salebrosus TDB-379]|nr:hypothetical protein M405DRAFT_517162 [Rhizopogon salebrosus TDB-379]
MRMRIPKAVEYHQVAKYHRHFWCAIIANVASVGVGYHDMTRRAVNLFILQEQGCPTAIR